MEPCNWIRGCFCLRFPGFTFKNKKLTVFTNELLLSDFKKIMIIVK